MRGVVCTPGGQPSSYSQRLVGSEFRLTADALCQELLGIKPNYCEKILQQQAYGFKKWHSDALAHRRTVQIFRQKGLVEDYVIRAYFDRLRLQMTGESAFCRKCILNYDRMNPTNDPRPQLAIVHLR